MPTRRQLSLFLKNEPGVLGRLCKTFATKKINIEAISVSDTVDHAVVRIIVSDPRRAREVLEEHGVLVIETEVLTIRLTDRPGALANVAEKLSKAKINIEYAYGTATRAKAKSMVVLRVSNLAKARKVLKV
jgi:hypothetical protein